MAKKKLPEFKNEDEICEFWETHDPEEYEGMEIPGGMHPTQSRPKKKMVSFRLDEELVERLNRLAIKKGLGYQTLMRMLLFEAVETEEQKETKRAV